MRKTIYLTHADFVLCWKIQKHLGDLQGVINVGVSSEDKTAHIDYIGCLKDELIKNRLLNLGCSVEKIVNG